MNQLDAMVRDWQRATDIAITLDLIGGIITIALLLWAAVWTHNAFKRYEAREEAKVRALQQIANGLRQKPLAQTDPLPEWAATR